MVVAGRPDLQPRLDCAIHYATELVPEQQRTRVRTAFSLETFEALDERERRGVTMLAEGLADNWSLEGLTALVYAVPKRLLGLPAEWIARPSGLGLSAKRRPK